MFNSTWQREPVFHLWHDSILYMYTPVPHMWMTGQAMSRTLVYWFDLPQILNEMPTYESVHKLMLHEHMFNGREIFHIWHDFITTHVDVYDLNCQHINSFRDLHSWIDVLWAVSTICYMNNYFSLLLMKCTLNKKHNSAMRTWVFWTFHRNGILIYYI